MTDFALFLRTNKKWSRNCLYHITMGTVIFKWDLHSQAASGTLK